MARTETSERKSSSSHGKKSGNGSGNGSAKSLLRSVVGTSAATDTLVDLVERLGLVDIVVGSVKSRIEQTDVDDLLDEATEYLRRNPEVLVVTLGAVTAATGLLVWLNSRREWDGGERRKTSGSVTSSPARPRRTTSARSEQ